ncbi:MAG: DUF3052 domain-containing protein [Anaerolineaceae bacterium]|nr:DUF3052 domain-containing protein [Anaerolineaceae bacterium]
MTSGYSGKPLVQKLGIKAGQRILIFNAPEGYFATLGELPDGVEMAHDHELPPFDLIQIFCTERKDYEAFFPVLRDALTTAGMLWVSWPKKAAKMNTDLDENLIREIGLANGLVDVKVIAVDERWSGLKFVRRLKDR